MIVPMSVAEITINDVVVAAGISYTVRKKEVEPGQPNYRYLYINGIAKPWHKHIDDSLPVYVPE